MSEKKVLVCVTKQKTCERLIKNGSKVAGKEGELFVLHVTNKSLEIGSCDVIQYLFDVSKKYDAQMSIINSKDVLKSLNDFVDQNKIDIVVLGESLERSSLTNMSDKITKDLRDNVKSLIIPMSYSYLDKDVI